jgi:hypothetical protein
VTLAEFSELLAPLHLDETAREARQEALLQHAVGGEASWDDHADLARTAILLEDEAIRAYRVSTTAPADSQARQLTVELFATLDECLRLLIALPDRSTVLEYAENITLPGALDLPFRVAASGLLSRNTAEVRLLLKDLVETHEDGGVHAPGNAPGELDWASRLLADIFGAFILLVRKQGGWSDIDFAIGMLERLRSAQQGLEAAYLRAAAERQQTQQAAARLVGLFHLAQAVTTTGRYLLDGRTSAQAVLARLDRHHDQAREAIEVSNAPGDATLLRMAGLLWAGCRELARNSIWHQVNGLGERLSEFATSLADRGRPNPVLELWPSQQEALSGNVLDQYRRAVLVQMPTSAGKTLLAEFMIIQSLALLPHSTVAYVVPTRALVNQVTRDLRTDLGPIGMTVEQAIPAYEIDPTEQVMLSDPPTVLVTTPEKLSLLIRRDHASLARLGLVVVDEAHSLADGERGARLELLLATIRRDKPGVRYLLLSPFLPEAQQLVDWLGDDRGLPPVSVNWRPSRRVVGTLTVQGRKPRRNLMFTTLDAAGGVDVVAGRQADLAPVANDQLPKGKSIKAISTLAAQRLKDRGNTLVLCWGAGTAMSRAGEIADGLPSLPSDPLRDSVARYLKAEHGDNYPLSAYLRVGVAYHHSGMSQEARALVECLIRRGLVHTVCGTTTLAQGVNFPISNVLIETRRKGRDATLNYADAWNIIGRAGRTLLDNVGLVGFPVVTAAQGEAWQAFLQEEAQAIASQLTELIDRANEIGERIGLQQVRLIPNLTDMLQFLAHAMRVSGAKQTAAELEDLLRNSLVYQQVRAATSQRADALVRLCRRYLEQIQDQAQTVALSDQTGFSTPTVGMLLGSRRDDPTLTDPDAWRPSALFGSDPEPITARMRVLGEVPELGRLGYEAAGTFSPFRAGQIISDWVNGMPVWELADRHARSSSQDVATETDRADFTKYLFSQLSYKASWGLGALETAYLPSRSASDVVPIEDDPRFVPSMVFFGVPTPQAVWMRMVGLPRVTARAAGELWARTVAGAPRSYGQLRDWLSSLDEATWDRFTTGQPIDGADMRRLWNEALT